jgi:hypothetical protein
LDIDSQILKHSEYLVGIQKETAKEDVMIRMFNKAGAPRLNKAVIL